MGKKVIQYSTASSLFCPFHCLLAIKKNVLISQSPSYTHRNHTYIFINTTARAAAVQEEANTRNIEKLKLKKNSHAYPARVQTQFSVHQGKVQQHQGHHMMQHNHSWQAWHCFRLHQQPHEIQHNIEREAHRHDMGIDQTQEPKNCESTHNRDQRQVHFIMSLHCPSLSSFITTTSTSTTTLLQIATIPIHDDGTISSIF